jgi:hypothetical protein
MCCARQVERDGERPVSMRSGAGHASNRRRSSRLPDVVAKLPKSQREVAVFNAVFAFRLTSFATCAIAWCVEATGAQGPGSQPALLSRSPVRRRCAVTFSNTADNRTEALRYMAASPKRKPRLENLDLSKLSSECRRAVGTIRAFR